MLEIILFGMLLKTALEQNTMWYWLMFGVHCAIIIIEMIIKYLESIIEEQEKGE